MNSYADLDTLKSRLGITATTYDTDLRKVLEAASRAIDGYCQRAFFVYEGTVYCDGAGPTLHLWPEVLSITTLKTDEGGDGTYDSTFAATDYHGYPLYGPPWAMLEIAHNSGYGGFAAGIKKGVEIIGTFGYGSGFAAKGGHGATPYTATAITATVADGTTTTVAVSAEGTVKAGHTIRAGTEQMYVTAATTDGTNQITAVRGVNGTTGAAQAAAAISIYEYPADVIEASLNVAAALWLRRGAKGVSAEKLGDYSVTYSDDSVKLTDIMELTTYRRLICH